MADEMRELVGIGERWVNLRTAWQARTGAPEKGDIEKFITGVNGLSGELISLTRVSDPDLMVALGEAFMNGAALVKGGEGKVSGG